MNLEIIVIDDNMSKTDPFIRNLSKKISNINIETFNDANDGSAYVLSNLDKKMIVFLDCRFDAGIQGVDALKRIREKTSLVYIIMMSANPLSQMESESLSSMINNQGIFFISNTETEKSVELVNNIIHLMNTKLDCVLEDWISNHTDEIQNRPYINSGDKTYTLKDVLSEIRKQTEFGKTIERNMILLAIDLIVRNKKKYD